MTRERTPIEPRRVSPGTRAKILAATDHVCARPGCPERAASTARSVPATHRRPPMTDPTLRALAEILRPRSIILLAVVAGVVSLWWL
jgi:hypothetical protein